MFINNAYSNTNNSLLSCHIDVHCSDGLLNGSIQGRTTFILRRQNLVTLLYLNVTSFDSGPHHYGYGGVNGFNV